MNRNFHFSSYMPIYYFTPPTLETGVLKNYKDLSHLTHDQSYENFENNVKAMSFLT